jgi:hypothetical protein
MRCDTIQDRLNDFVDDLLPDQERQKVEQHLERCASCRQEAQLLRALLEDAAGLPKSFSPPRDLWPGIAARIEREKIPIHAWITELRNRANGAASWAWEKIAAIRASGSGHWVDWGFRGAIAMAVLLLAVGGVWWLTQSPHAGWEVARLQGTPTVGSALLEDTGRLAVGEWLETDDSSRAKIDVGMIGHVEIEPNTRIRLVEAKLTDHRLALARGAMHAVIWAPPRLFFVETPSALAVDLGCEYTLEVDDEGVGLLHVTRGYVALEKGKGHESVVPAGAYCAMRPESGPGTPYSEDATEAFRTALAQLDFENGGLDAINIILAEAREADTFTLWHLLFRVNPSERALVYDRMVALLPPPEGVTREGVLRGDKRMLDLWAEKFGLGFSWWRYWLPL